MAKIRINKLALELNVQNDQVIEALEKKGHPVKNYMSSIDEDVAADIREFFLPTPPDKKGQVKAKAKTKAEGKKTVVITAKTQKEDAARAKAKAKAEPKKEEPPKKAKSTATAKSASDEVEAEAPKTTSVSRKVTKKVAKKTQGKSTATENQETASDTSPKKAGLKIVKHDEKAKEEEDEKKKAAPKIIKKEAAPSAPPPPPQAEVPKPDKPKPPVVQTEPAAVEEEFEMVQLPENIVVRDLAEKLKCTPNDIIKELMGLGLMATINQTLSYEVAGRVADLRGFEVTQEAVAPELDFEEEEIDLPEDRCPRPPVVTIMGHVDHGKTSLLDAIRKTDLTSKEAGGITQRIGAYQAKIKGHAITFLDTPGHEAFTAMRARGAQVTDIVVLVVAADDGIKPQTKEAIHHANAGGVPILVAINKIDKPDAKPDEVKKQLADEGLLPEDWGGQTIFGAVSAKEKIGIDSLLEMILLQAEVMELKVNPKLRARGVVIESKLDKGRGPVATIIVQKGTLRIGDPFMVGPYFGKVRALINDKGQKISVAPPATPVEVVGMPEVPQPGEAFIVVSDERKARQLSDQRVQLQRETQLAQSARVTLEDLHQQIVEGKIQELNLIIKADVQGSSHAVQEAFSKLETNKVRIKIIHEAVGGITESDVLLASASNAIITGFNVRPTEKASHLASRENVAINLYTIIYDAIDDMKKALQGLLEPRFKEIIVGRAEVREVFTIPKVGSIAGCQVTSGKLERNLVVRLIRDSVVVHQGKISSLKRFKEDVKEVISGYECGLSLEKYQDIKKGDIIEPFILEEIPH